MQKNVAITKIVTMKELSIEEKNLLLKDLCARLPYGVIGVTEEGVESPLLTRGEADWDIITSINYRIKKFGWKPYLRSISNMTEEEQFQLGRLLGATSYNLLKGEYSSLKELLEYFCKNHIDLFEFISKGLALEAPRDMYKF